jgi:mannose-6-phosphate isomerase-like protein (cupin superfamily)
MDNGGRRRSQQSRVSISITRPVLHDHRHNAGMNAISRPNTPTSLANAEHYVWGDGCDGWHLLKQPDLSVIQERVPAGRGEVKHFHSRARQFFLVLRGAATLEFDDSSITFGEGEGVHVMPGVQHRFVNAGSETVEFLVISAPTTQGDRTNVQNREGAA